MSTSTTSSKNRPPRRRLQLLLGLLVPLTVVLGLSDTAQAAFVTRDSTFACNYDTTGPHSVTVFFPELRTGGGNETVYFSPVLYKSTSSGLQPWRTKPWYGAKVGPNYIYTGYNGFKWFVDLGSDYARGFQNSAFQNLSPGWYAVKGYFYGGSSQWLHKNGTSNEYYCYVP